MEEEQTPNLLTPVTEEMEKEPTPVNVHHAARGMVDNQPFGLMHHMPQACWTDWFDRDDPSGSGDWETLGSLHRANPGKICPNPIDIEVQTLNGLTVSQTGDVIYRSDTTTGFVCRNRDQRWWWWRPCNDYRVRFRCHPPYCGGVCWTNWYDRDNPSGTGDWELLYYLRRQYPGQICNNPLHIQAVTTYGNIPATLTGDVIYISNPTQGFACRNRDQRYRWCRDYKVRYGCPCWNVA
ncbi:uncharacterized protein LOC142941915 [Anarhichas minor]|uniref:uncharacterized protein LOC142941915 n=1 Tax=Anarhichas minor TaxID=65739 RepID=UPI003F740F2D